MSISPHLQQVNANLSVEVLDMYHPKSSILQKNIIQTMKEGGIRSCHSVKSVGYIDRAYQNKEMVLLLRCMLV